MTKKTLSHDGAIGIDSKQTLSIERGSQQLIGHEHSQVHLVGSVAMDSCDEVFARVAEKLGEYMCRIPDGETGERSKWILFQRAMLRQHPAMEVDPTVPEFELRQWDGKVMRSIPMLRIRDDADPATLEFPTGYAEAAIESYAVFRTKRDAGIVPRHARFQVCLPTPMATGYMYVSYTDHDTFHVVYERSLLRALLEIVAHIPHEDLAIQIDVCQEVLLFEGYFEHRPDNYKSRVFAMLHRLSVFVPDDVQFGIHLCYGSPFDAPLVRPKDMSTLVELANGIAECVDREIDFMHLPVPQGRSEPAFYKPLRDLDLSPATRVYLGLILQGDPEGDQERIAVAREFLEDFGVATECGWGRTAPENVAGLLDSHRVAAESL